PAHRLEPLAKTGHGVARRLGAEAPRDVGGIVGKRRLVGHAAQRGAEAFEDLPARLAHDGAPFVFLSRIQARKAPPRQGGSVWFSPQTRSARGRRNAGTRPSSRPADSARRHDAGRVARRAKEAIEGAAPAGRTPARLPRSRRRNSRSGRGMSTGQTSLQAPQRLEARGRSANSAKWSPASSGVSTAPTGPE